jgi:hypothetical protein
MRSVGRVLPVSDQPWELVHVFCCCLRSQQESPSFVCAELIALANDLNHSHNFRFMHSTTFRLNRIPSTTFGFDLMQLGCDVLQVKSAITSLMLYL